MFKRENVYESYTDKWHDKPQADKMWKAFKAHFTKASQNFNRKLTTRGAGLNAAALAAKQMANQSDGKENHGTVKADGISLYYCWTHGLTPNPGHTSATCKFHAQGHNVNATITNTMGGSNAFWVPGMPKGYGKNRKK